MRWPSMCAEYVLAIVHMPCSAHMCVYVVVKGGTFKDIFLKPNQMAVSADYPVAVI